MIQLSVVIITFNEEKRIENCLKSVEDLADEIIVVDSYSTDKTREICERYGVHFIQRKWTNFGDAKRYAVGKASFDYILSLDADEVLSKTLHESIQMTKENWTADAYNFNRLNHVGKQAVHRGGWYPDCKIRLFDRRKANWKNIPVHEYVVPTVNDCKIIWLQGDLFHYSFANIEGLRKSSKLALYARMYEKKKKLFKPFLYLKAGFRFFQIYLLNLGFLDGKVGLEIAKARTRYVIQKYS